jgi:hypothetical protein
MNRLKVSPLNTRPFRSEGGQPQLVSELSSSSDLGRPSREPTPRLQPFFKRCRNKPEGREHENGYRDSMPAVSASKVEAASRARDSAIGPPGRSGRAISPSTRILKRYRKERFLWRTWGSDGLQPRCFTENSRRPPTIRTWSRIRRQRSLRCCAWFRRFLTNYYPSIRIKHCSWKLREVRWRGHSRTGQEPPPHGAAAKLSSSALFGGKHPIVAALIALRSRPDERATATARGLTLVTDGRARESLRTDVSTAFRAFGNGEY